MRDRVKWPSLSDYLFQLVQRLSSGRILLLRDCPPLMSRAYLQDNRGLNIFSLHFGDFLDTKEARVSQLRLKQLLRSFFRVHP